MPRDTTKKTTAKKSTTKKSAAKKPTKEATSSKATSKKATSKKAAPKKAASKKTASMATNGAPAESSSARRSRSDGTGNGGSPKASEVALLAVRALLNLTGKDAEGVIGLQRTDDGWTVEIEVLELRRVPETTDVLATYEVAMDGGGDMTGYRRLQRYVRGAPGED